MVLAAVGVRPQQQELIFGELHLLPDTLIVHRVDLLRRRALGLEGVQAGIGQPDLPPPGIGLLLGDTVRPEILRRNAHHLCLDPGHNILGHQHRRSSVLPQPPAYLENAVVPAGGVHAVGQAYPHMVDLQPQGAASGQGYPFHQTALAAQFLQEPDHLPGTASLFPFGILEPVQLLQHCQGQDDVIILKGLQCLRGLDQHIGIQYIGLLHNSSAFPPQRDCREALSLKKHSTPCPRRHPAMDGSRFRA